MSEIPPLPDDWRPLLHTFLHAQPTLALATGGEADGRPQVAPLFFASDEALNLYWISDPDSRHSVNIKEWNDVAAAVFESGWDWHTIKGVQFEGDAMVVTEDEERQHALILYQAKFPFATDKFMAMLSRSVIYVLRPRWLRWIDNTRRLGYQQEFSVIQDGG